MPINPYFLVSEAVSKVVGDQNIGYNLDKRTNFVESFLLEKYVKKLQHKKPQKAARFALPDGTQGILGWTIVDDLDPEHSQSKNVFLYLEAPEGKNNIKFSIEDVEVDFAYEDIDLKRKLIELFHSVKADNKLMVDLFNFGNVFGESGRFFQELKFSDEINKVYKIPAKVVLFNDLDYSQQDTFEQLFLVSLERNALIKKSYKNHFFKKNLSSIIVRDSFLDFFIRASSPYIKVVEIATDRDFLYKIFEEDLQSFIYETKADDNLLAVFEMDLYRQEKAISSFIYDVYSSNTEFFSEVPETEAKIIKFMDEFTNKLLYLELSQYLGEGSELSKLKDAAISKMVQSTEVLTPQELRLLKGEEYFPSGLYYSLLLDLDKAEPSDKNLILSKLKLLEDKLLEVGCDYIDIAKQR